MESSGNKACRICIDHQEQLLEDGDGSQVICDHLHISNEKEDGEVVVVTTTDVPVAVVDVTEVSSYASTHSTTRKRKFISSSDFVDKADNSTKRSLSEIIKWTELDFDMVYRVHKVHEHTIKEVVDSKNRIGYYAELRDANEKLINVWITKIIRSNLVIHKLEEEKIYMKPLPQRRSKSTGYFYNHCAIVVDM